MRMRLYHVNQIIVYCRGSRYRAGLPWSAERGMLVGLYGRCGQSACIQWDMDWSEISARIIDQ